MAAGMSDYEKAMIEETRRHNAAMEAAVTPPVVPLTSPDDQFKAEMAERRGTHLPQIPSTLVPCKSPDTNATFNAKIVRDLVTDLEGYTLPDGHDRHEDDMPPGLVPHGKEMRDSHGQETPDYKQWKWTEFYQRDLKSFVGRKLPAYARAEKAV